jgi:hypothetical protein
MGTDIHGMIECRARADADEDGSWCAAVDLGLLHRVRDYDGFGCLFGVRNYANFRPVVPLRGAPADLSAPVRAELDDWGTDAHSVTWITWPEVEGVDWDEPAEAPDDRIHEYRRMPDGSLVFASKALWSARFAAVIGRSDLGFAPGYGEPGRPEGTEWDDGDRLYRVERLRRSDAVAPDGAWQPVWAVMRVLAGLHGGENVRLVVWFDN